MMASSIGLVVTAGITNTFVQMSQRIRQIEAKQQREIFYNYIRRHFKDPENCKATLNAKGGFASGAKTYYADAGDSTKDLDGDGTDDHEWTIPKLLVPDGSDADTDPDVHLDFYPSDQTKKDSLEKRFWEKWGIEKFDSIMFIHDKANGSHLRVHIWNIAPGGMPYPAGPYMIPLTVTTRAAASPDKGEKIESCGLTEAAQSAKAEEDLSCPEMAGLDDGDNHSNGGGFVAHTASVASTVYVGPDAEVCGKAKVKGRVRIENTSKVYGKAEINGPGPAPFTGTLYIRRGAQVFGSAKVTGRGYISDNAKVSGHATVSMTSSNLSYNMIQHNAVVTGRAVVSGDISIGGDAYIDGDAKISLDGSGGGIFGHIRGNARIGGNAELSGKVTISGSPRISGKAKVISAVGVIVSGGVVIDGEAEVTGGTLSGDVRIGRNATVSMLYGSGGGNATITGDAKISGNAEVSGRPVISGDVVIDGDAEVSGGTITGNTKISGDAEVKGGTLSGNTKISGDAIVTGGTHYNKTYSTGTHN